MIRNVAHLRTGNPTGNFGFLDCRLPLPDKSTGTFSSGNVRSRVAGSPYRQSGKNPNRQSGGSTHGQPPCALSCPPTLQSLRVHVLPLQVTTTTVFVIALHVGAGLPLPAAVVLAVFGVPLLRRALQRTRGAAVEHGDPFDDGTSDADWKDDFRFTREHVRALARALALPRVIRLPSRHKMDRDVAMLLLLARHASAHTAPPPIPYNPSSI